MQRFSFFLSRTPLTAIFKITPTYVTGPGVAQDSGHILRRVGHNGVVVKLFLSVSSVFTLEYNKDTMLELIIYFFLSLSEIGFNEPFNIKILTSLCSS